MTIPVALLKEVFGNTAARDLLLHLVEAGPRVRYSRAREALGVHPQRFQRALDRLEEFGLVGLQAPADINRPHAERTYYVFLEATALGTFAAELWYEINKDYGLLVQRHNLSADAIAATGLE